MLHRSYVYIYYTFLIRQSFIAREGFGVGRKLYCFASYSLLLLFTFHSKTRWMAPAAFHNFFFFSCSAATVRPLDFPVNLQIFESLEEKSLEIMKNLRILKILLKIPLKQLDLSEN